MSRTSGGRDSENEDEDEEEIPIYCCLHFSCAIHYGIIKIDYEGHKISISLKSQSLLSEAEKNVIYEKLFNLRVSSHVNPDYILIIHCPWCGLHMRDVIDFEKSSYASTGAYSSKEGWER